MLRPPPRIFLLLAMLLPSCGVDAAVVANTGESPPEPKESAEPPAAEEESAAPADGEEPVGPGGIVADLRADNNRDGKISFDDPADNSGEETWGKDHGAVFLANIDDDEDKCPKTGNDVDLPKCNDAADDVLNGPDDALDLARLKTKPWPEAPTDAKGTVSFTNAQLVRLFRVKGTSFAAIESGAALSAADVKGGVELAIEAKDIVRDRAVWDGYVDVTFKVTADGKSASDVVRMRVSPLMTYHHVSPAEQTWVSTNSYPGNAAMRADLAEALTAAGLPPVTGIATSDPWNQDYFETAFMSMPGPGGKQHAIRVNMRSANNSFGGQGVTSANPLRAAGRAVFTTMRGKDSAGLQEFDPTRNGKNDTLNSFGNFETIPPYSHNGKSYPMGRVLRGSIPTYAVDKRFQGMIDAQLLQPAIFVDTSWLAVSHIDETVSFVKASTPRRWKMLVNDATMAKNMLVQQSNAGKGSVPMFVGKYWDQSSPAQVTIDGVLADDDVMSASAEAAVEIDAQVAKIKAETGLTDNEIVRIPFLHMTTGGYSIAFQPGMVNGIYVTDADFIAPDPHGPIINGKDIFKVAMEQALAPLAIKVHFAEDWDGYHRNLGEVHCGTNATRQIPVAKWWESGL